MKAGGHNDRQTIPNPVNHSDDLFNLVHSLTRQEKRYFRLLASMQRGEKKYLRLFEAISVQKEHDDEQLRAALCDEGGSEHLHVAKRYLFDMILRSLRLYREKNMPPLRTQNRLREVEILYEKGLMKPARKLWRKVREEAEYNGNYLAMLIALEQEEKLCRGGRGISATEFQKRREQMLLRLERLCRLDYLNRRVLEVLTDHGDVCKRKEMLREVVEDPLFHELPEGESFNYRELFFHTRALYYFGLRRYRESLEELLRCNECFEDDPSLISRFPEVYVKLLGNLITVLTRSGDSRSGEILTELGSRVASVLCASRCPVSVAGKLRVRILHYRLTHHARFGEFGECVALTAEAEENIERFGPYADRFDVAHILYFLSCARFMQGDYRGAREYEERIMVGREPRAGKPFYRFLRLYALILSFELGEIDRMENILRRIERSFARREAVPAIELLLHSFFRDHLRLADRRKRVEHLHRLAVEAAGLEGDAGSHYYLQYFDVGSWLRRRRQKERE